jgi:hypothetical protein
MEPDTAPVEKKKRPRSPAYPAIGLQEALTRAHLLYKQEKRNFAHLDTILHHWGYRPKSGGGLVVVAALKKFGLVEDEGGGNARRARVSEFGLRLLLLDEHEHADERRKLLKEAALKPEIHAELWKKYQGALPSDSTLRYELLTDRGFTESGVREFIPELRSTLAYAGVTEADKLPDSHEDKKQENEPGFKSSLFGNGHTSFFGKADMTPGAAQPATVTARMLHLPLQSASWAMLQVPFPMSEEDWDQMLSVLMAMKPGIVRPATMIPAVPEKVAVVAEAGPEAVADRVAKADAERHATKQ